MKNTNGTTTAEMQMPSQPAFVLILKNSEIPAARKQIAMTDISPKLGTKNSTAKSIAQITKHISAINIHQNIHSP
jgi:hypothetical protein